MATVDAYTKAGADAMFAALALNGAATQAALASFGVRPKNYTNEAAANAASENVTSRIVWLTAPTGTFYRPGLYQYNGTTWKPLGADSICGFMVHRSTNQSTTSGVNATLLYDATDWDSHGGYNPATGTYTVPTNQGGLWLVHSASSFASNVTGSRTMISPITGEVTGVSAAVDNLGRLSLTLPIVMNAGFTLTTVVVQNSGGLLNATPNAYGNPQTMSAFRIGTTV